MSVAVAYTVVRTSLAETARVFDLAVGLAVTDIGTGECTSAALTLWSDLINQLLHLLFTKLIELR